MQTQISSKVVAVLFTGHSSFFKRTARLQLTDELIGDLNVSQLEDSSKDMQRIQELLSLPQNKDVTQDSSSQ